MQISKEINRLYLQKSKEINLNKQGLLNTDNNKKYPLFTPKSTLQKTPTMTSDDTL